MLSIQGNDFVLNGEKFKIYSGAIHYFRTFPQQWADRLRKLKACGFNCVETYVAWNAHEPHKGEFCFDDLLDLVQFLRLAQEIGLYAIVRPGPYICAEWEFGGLPAWLLAEDDLRLRCNEPKYLAHVRDWYNELLGRLAPLQIHKGGNIIAMQVENEYGSYGNDHDYLRAVEQIMRDAGIELLLFTSDGWDSNMLSGGTLPHLLKTANFGSGANHGMKALRRLQTEGPLMCMEFWDGWFDHWGERHHVRPAKHFALSFQELLNTGASANVYMFHGGTNFGFWAGANQSGSHYQPTVTSYDYDALLTEWGDYTKKYHAARKILAKHRGITPEALPPVEKPRAYGKVRLTQSAALLENLESLSTPIQSVTPEYMEKFGQNTGLILYRHILHGDYSGWLHIDGLGDRAWVFVDGSYKGLLWRNTGGGVNLGKIPDGAQIDVLVEGLGRTNYGPDVPSAHKGARQIRIGNQLLYDWLVFPLPLEDLGGLAFKATADKAFTPRFYTGSFTATEKADTFVRLLENFTHGVVWVNGFNLGRYWDIGPQETLYLPAPLLQDENIITVLELEETPKKAEISLEAKPRLGSKWHGN
ncbi:MAG: beta-galactosidase [Oscillospiraceae bacterium]|jgi:beta-galactosidase|nr:beta-galactosidase [Oscillospiraceae bacterium]